MSGPIVTAVVLAAGEGTRMGAATPKVLLEIEGMSVLERSVAAFATTPEVDTIIVVAHPGLVVTISNMLGRAPKVEAVVPGGETRSASTLAGLGVIASDTGIVLIHDAARPLITPAIISNLVAALAGVDAATVAVPAGDTMLRVRGDRIIDIPDRSEQWHAQTPQGFKLQTLRAAYEAAGHAKPDFTDDCSIVRRYLPDVAIRVVPGSEENLKITRPADISLAERILVARSGR
jgi:2-C-methyl-D-erythritol 4-phosphate cytidylyltransferase